MKFQLSAAPVLIVAVAVLLAGALGAIVVARGVLASEPAGTPPPTPLELPEPPDKLQVVTDLQPQASSPAAKPPVVSRSEAAAAIEDQGNVYSWQDGDRTLNVVLLDDLVVQHTDNISPGADVVARGGAGSIVRVESANTEDSLPVFRSQSGGGLMTLPGGVLLSLDPQWDQDQVDSFFSQNGISMDRVEALGFLPNAFLVNTAPGFPSLDLANSLAAQDGVEVSSPNWWTQFEAK